MYTSPPTRLRGEVIPQKLPTIHNVCSISQSRDRQGAAGADFFSRLLRDYEKNEKNSKLIMCTAKKGCRLFFGFRPERMLHPLQPGLQSAVPGGQLGLQLVERHRAADLRHGKQLAVQPPRQRLVGERLRRPAHVDCFRHVSNRLFGGKKRLPDRLQQPRPTLRSPTNPRPPSRSTPPPAADWGRGPSSSSTWTRTVTPTWLRCTAGSTLPPATPAPARSATTGRETTSTQCTITGASLSLSGNVLTLNLTITFNASFAGAKTTYMQAVDPASASRADCRSCRQVSREIFNPLPKTEL